MRYHTSFLVTSLAVFAIMSAAGQAQELAIPPPSATPLTFDIATIHLSKDPTPDDPCTFHPMPSGEGYLAHCMTLRIMIGFLYRIPGQQILGIPDTLNAEHFDIEAKSDKPYNVDELHIMFQNLLADRFGLKFHTEKKQGNIYALTIDSSGLKMTLNTDPDDFQIPITGAMDGLHGKHVSMNYLCWQLGEFTRDDERPVVNMTGLTGNYNYVLTFLPPLPPNYDKDSLPPGFMDRPNLFEALRKQLGLKLVPQKGPVTYMVIDHIEEPTEN
jgi:uncharacterized protein (TIGR03435 family)